MSVTIRQATSADAPAVVQLYEAVHTAEEAGQLVTGWKRGVYPTAQTVAAALSRQDLYVAEDGGVLVAAAVINQAQDPSYAQCSWGISATASEVLVLHTLAVVPQSSGQGYGTAFVRFYEGEAKRRGCRCLRMDTQVINAAARRLYARLGYREAGVVGTVFNGIPGVKLVCLEKGIEQAIDLRKVAHHP